VAELQAVLDGEPGVGLVAAQLGGDLLQDRGLQRVLLEHLEAGQVQQDGAVAAHGRAVPQHLADADHPARRPAGGQDDRHALGPPALQLGHRRVADGVVPA
jgi:hypothetical protein